MVPEPGLLNLETLWFALIAVLWIGFFVLEGFDFGIGMLYPFLGRDDPERHALLATILPVWDSYEVWLIVAAGAMFAAFPGWYAGLFSGFYLPLFGILVALIVRGVAIEYRNKHTGATWRRRWDVAMPISCLLVSFLFGVLFAGMLNGLPMDADGLITVGPGGLFSGYAVLAGLTFVAVFLLHGALFLTLRTRDDLEVRSRRAALWCWPAAAALLTGFLAWTGVRAASPDPQGILSLALIGATFLAGVAAGPLVWLRRAGIAFAATSAAILLLVASLLVWLYPRVLVSSSPGVPSPTVFSTASSTYTLVAMTIVAIIFVPIVLAYQGWALRVFRARFSRDDFADPPSAADLLRRGPLGGGGSDRGTGATDTDGGEPGGQPGTGR
ncbi:cytochrome d oxidase cyd, subunit II [Saccharomonospora marina XMU15]|uniref:Cytochrome d oxidase cyd, subunit II n=1 Tax=Saccharomonospora marina XMU15 TaxID=882083 RepID=H5X5R8_9PSEU|nr:cytochrome d ubiquinol oxidase subunit II [Saccharomonospora marina]EHR51216.1 cytochrome d oxidase cyd, subunit II [Saccharomonospora marina XMU15]